MLRSTLFLAFALLLLSHAAFAEEVRVANRADLIQALRNAKPGVTILVAPGTYDGGLSQSGLQGTKDHPITIAAADSANPPVISGGSAGLHLSSPQHVELRDLIIQGARGNGLNIDDAGAGNPAGHDIVLRNVTVRDVGPEGNRDGIKLSGLDHFRIENCQVEQWGAGGSAIDMVGCHHGIVTGCKFHNARSESANGVQAKGASSDIVIQRSRFQNSGGRAINAGGSTGQPYFRPLNASYEARNITVEDCEFLGGGAAVAFVGVDGALFQHNTIYRPRRWVIRILQENTDPRFVPSRNGRFENNVIVFRSDEVSTVANIGPKTQPETFAFNGNTWHCLDRPADSQRLLKLPVPETNGTYGKDPGFADAENSSLEIQGRASNSAGVRPHK